MRKYHIIKNDENYKLANNYTQALYNFPVTINYTDNNIEYKLIISSGNNDTILIDKYNYILNYNIYMEYAGLSKIVNNEVIEIIFIQNIYESYNLESGNKKDFFNDLEHKDMIEYLQQWEN